MNERDWSFIMLICAVILFISVTVYVSKNPRISNDDYCKIYYVNENQHTWTDYPGKIAIEDDIEHTLFPDSSAMLDTGSGKFIRGLIQQGTNKIMEATCLYDVRVAVIKDDSVAIVRFQAEAEINVTDLGAWKTAAEHGNVYEGVYTSFLREQNAFQERAILVANMSCEEVCAT